MLVSPHLVCLYKHFTTKHCTTIVLLLLMCTIQILFGDANEPVPRRMTTHLHQFENLDDGLHDFDHGLVHEGLDDLLSKDLDVSTPHIDGGHHGDVGMMLRGGKGKMVAPPNGKSIPTGCDFPVCEFVYLVTPCTRVPAGNRHHQGRGAGAQHPAVSARGTTVDTRKTCCTPRPQDTLLMSCRAVVIEKTAGACCAPGVRQF